MKQAILVVSFGTTHPDTLEKTIFAVEREIQSAYPEIPCFRAFTSSIIRRRLKANQGLEVDGVEEALSRLSAAGFTHVVIQPTLLLPGEEYDKLCSAARAAAGSLEVTLGLPLLWDERDVLELARALKLAYPVPEDTVLLAMGHGTSHQADAVYLRLRSAMQEMGMELCTVEGAVDFETAETALLAQSKRKVHLVPLLLVAGEHSKKDMAGDEEDSLKSRLEAAGFAVSYSLQGLGELPEIRRMYINRIAGAFAHKEEQA